MGYVSVIGHADRAGPLRLRELYKNLAISQRELDQAASDQQTAKAICGRRCQQEAPTPSFWEKRIISFNQFDDSRRRIGEANSAIETTETAISSRTAGAYRS